MDGHPGNGERASTCPEATPCPQEPKLGKLSRLLDAQRLQQQEHFERLLMSHEQRILHSLGSSINEHCRQACEQTLMHLGGAQPGSLVVEQKPSHFEFGQKHSQFEFGHKPTQFEPAFLPTSFPDPSLVPTTLPEDDGHVDSDGFCKEVEEPVSQESTTKGSSVHPGRQVMVDEAQIREDLVCRRHGRKTSLIYHHGSLSGYRYHMQRLLQTRRFDNAMTGLIMLNAIAIGVQVDWSVKHPAQEPPMVFRCVDLTFAALFTVELFFRVCAEAWRFFSYKSPRFMWNLLDTLLVLTVLFDELTQLFWVKTLDIPSAKLVRLLRLARIVRVLRLVREFHDLEIMVLGIIHSFKSLLWAMVLLSMIVFMFGSIFMDFVSNELSADLAMGAHTVKHQALIEHFGTMWLTVYTLFKAISGGIDWENAALPLLGISPVLGILFCVYVGFSMFCVLNIITAVFVDHATRLCEKDEENLVQQVLEARQRQIKEVTAIFKCASQNNNNEMTSDELKYHLADVSVQACFARLGIDFESQSKLFELLDLDGNGKVTVQEFSQGIQMLQAHVSRADIDRLCRSHNNLQLCVQELAYACRDFSEFSDLAYELRAKKSAPDPEGLPRDKSCRFTASIAGFANGNGLHHESQDGICPAGAPKAAPGRVSAAVVATAAAEAALRAAAAEVDVDPTDACSACSVQASAPRLPGTINEEPHLLT